MVGFPAARLGDPHTCPMCMGATLPVIPPCAVTVMIGKKPAARMTDLCSCVAPIPVPVDMIIFGSPTVLICGLPASRQFDPTVKGGLILMGEPSVMIGIVATPAPGAPGGLNVWEETLADGSVVTHVGANITIKGSKAFRDAVVRDLQRLDATPTGHDLLQSLNAPGKGPVTIVHSAAGNSVNGTTAGANLRPDGTAGPGSGSTLNYNPDKTQIGDGSQAYMNRPPAVGLGHELVHCEQAQNGTWSGNKTGGVENDELAAVGLPPYQNNSHTENKIRSEMGQPPRTKY